MTPGCVRCEEWYRLDLASRCPECDAIWLKSQPVAIRRLIEEVRAEDPDKPNSGYNRVYSRHNRS